MHFSWCLLINLVLIGCVAGIIDRGRNAESPCNEVVLTRDRRDSPSYWMRDIDNLVMVTFISKERLRRFEMRFDIKADRNVRLQLTNNGNFSAANVIYNLHIGNIVHNGDQHTSLDRVMHGDTSTTIKDITTPCILVPSKYREFYLKMNDRKLVFGVEGSTPILTHEDPQFELIDYFQFHYGWEDTVNIRYGCPFTC